MRLSAHVRYAHERTECAPTDNPPPTSSNQTSKPEHGKCKRTPYFGIMLS